MPVDEAVARIVEHIRNRVNEDPKPSTELLSSTRLSGLAHI